MTKFKICILTSEYKEDSKFWIDTLTNNNLEFTIIDITHQNWLDKVIELDSNVFIARPPGVSEKSKQLYDERLYIVNNVLKRLIYPSYNEVLVYENKRFLSYFLASNNVPAPKTYVFYGKHEADDFCSTTSYPIVAKTNIGASGSGVRILKTKESALDYIKQTFSSKGAPKRWGPNTEKGGLLKRGLRYVLNPKAIIKKLKIYSEKRSDKQIGYLIFQEYIEHSFEWRCVRIGDSFFAHKKLKIGEKASGSLLKGYENPPLNLFDFVKQVTDKLGFNSLAIDIFENSNGDYLVNEMQCYFGQSDAFQMMVDDKIGRYRYVNDNWVFEEGDYAKNACYDLRLQHLLEILQRK